MKSLFLLQTSTREFKRLLHAKNLILHIALSEPFFIGLEKEQEFSGLRAIFAPIFCFRNLIKKVFENNHFLQGGGHGLQKRTENIFLNGFGQIIHFFN